MNGVTTAADAASTIAGRLRSLEEAVDHIARAVAQHGNRIMHIEKKVQVLSDQSGLVSSAEAPSQSHLVLQVHELTKSKANVDEVNKRMSMLENRVSYVERRDLSVVGHQLDTLESEMKTKAGLAELKDVISTSKTATEELMAAMDTVKAEINAVSTVSLGKMRGDIANIEELQREDRERIRDALDDQKRTSDSLEELDKFVQQVASDASSCNDELSRMISLKVSEVEDRIFGNVTFDATTLRAKDANNGGRLCMVLCDLLGIDYAGGNDNDAREKLAAWGRNLASHNELETMLEGMAQKVDTAEVRDWFSLTALQHELLERQFSNLDKLVREKEIASRHEQLVRSHNSNRIKDAADGLVASSWTLPPRPNSSVPPHNMASARLSMASLS